VPYLGIRKDNELLEKIQHRYTKMIMNMHDKAYEERLRCLRTWTLEERRNKQDLIEVFKINRRLSNVLLHQLFTLDEDSKGTKRHLCKLVKTRCTRDITKYFFQIKLSTDGICWTSRQWMLLASMHSSRLVVYIRDNRMGYLWTSPLNPRPYWLDDLPVRLHAVNHKVNHT